ncbi:ABC transporter permease subunit [Treponema sp.]|uniref:ABC transporter permease subunit n=1 Tax=Treponema sp. TaxID=166 RepID=UPI00388F417F
MEKNKQNSQKKFSYRQEFFSFCLGIFVIALLIQILGKAKGNPLVFPDIFEICRAFFRLMITPKTYQCILTTLLHLVTALILSFLAGILTGIAQGASSFLRKTLAPLMIMLRSIPVIVLVVIIMLLTDYSKVPYIASTLVLIPVISEAVCEGFLNIDKDLIDVYRLNSSFSPRILFSVYLPLMTGFLRQAFINTIGMGMKIIVSSEYLVQTKNSLGKAIYSSSYFNDYQDIYAYALIMILTGILLTKLPIFIIKKVTEN